MVTGINFARGSMARSANPSDRKRSPFVADWGGGRGQPRERGRSEAGFPRTKCKFPYAKLLLPLLLCLVYKVFFFARNFSLLRAKILLIDDEKSFSFFLQAWSVVLWFFVGEAYLGWSRAFLFCRDRIGQQIFFFLWKEKKRGGGVRYFSREIKILFLYLLFFFSLQVKLHCNLVLRKVWHSLRYTAGICNIFVFAYSEGDLLGLILFPTRIRIFE